MEGIIYPSWAASRNSPNPRFRNGGIEYATMITRERSRNEKEAGDRLKFLYRRNAMTESTVIAATDTYSALFRMISRLWRVSFSVNGSASRRKTSDSRLMLIWARSAPASPSQNASERKGLPR